MTLQQIKSKQYWIRVGGYFIWFLITFTLISFVFRNGEEPFWSLKEIQSRSVFAFFMSIVFAYRHRDQSLGDKPDDADIKKQPWTLKQFLSVFGLLLLFSFIVMTVLFSIGWIILEILYEESTPVVPIFIRMLLVTAIMTFLAVLILFLCEKFGISWTRKRT